MWRRVAKRCAWYAWLGAFWLLWKKSPIFREFMSARLHRRQQTARNVAEALKRAARET